MTYHRPVFTGNVLKERLSCVKPSEKTGGKNQQKITVRKKNQDQGRIYTPGNLLLAKKVINIHYKIRYFLIDCT